MVNRAAELGAATVLTVLVASLALPVALQPETVNGPVAGWWTAFALHLVGLLGTMWLSDLLPQPWRLAAVALMMLSAISMVLLAPTAGWMPLVLIVSATLCVHHLPLRAVAGVITANAACLLLGLHLADVAWGYVVMITGLYTLVMVVAVLSDRSHLLVQQGRTELAVLNTELRSTQALLDESSRTDERLRIARDLHDVMGHQLTALILELEIASHHAEGEARDHVVRARGIARDLMDDVRSTVADHRAASPDLRSALRQIADGAAGIEVDLSVEADLPTDGAAFTALVRCTQEVVTNALRHSQATRLWISVTADDGLVVLRARDNGIGARALVPGNGLTGITERAEALGGSTEFGSVGGFHVTARVPAT